MDPSLESGKANLITDSVTDSSAWKNQFILVFQYYTKATDMFFCLSLLCLEFLVGFYVVELLLALPTKHHTICHTISKGFNVGLVSLHGFVTQISGISVDWIQAETLHVPSVTTGWI